MTGHLLGAAGAVEGVYSALALHHGMLLADDQLRKPDPACDLDYVRIHARKADVKVVCQTPLALAAPMLCVIFARCA
jgi:3-oxoacyl-[acyl-carrier-protein] synthase II